MKTARAIGYTSINFDLVYGLPLQTSASVKDTINQVMQLQPDRISFYSYAHVPWVKGVGQRRYSEADLPKDEEKRALYDLGKTIFVFKIDTIVHAFMIYACLEKDVTDSLSSLCRFRS
jgi:oxygen-independent coproporphyrinogen-3 oxidase